MFSFTDKFKIPTLLGLGIIILGIFSGVFLIVKDQIFKTEASLDLAPQNITVTNIENSFLTVSWQTTGQTSSFITFGQTSADEKVVLDDRDSNLPQPRSTHYVTIKNLKPQTIYQFKIVSGKLVSDTFTATTASPLASQTGLTPVIGSVLDEGKPLDEGIAYLSISGAIIQSALVKNSGNFLIPLSFIRKADLSDIFQASQDSIGKLTVISKERQASAIFKLRSSGSLLPPLKLGQNMDLTGPPTPASDLDKFDLNGDKLINTADYAVLLQNFGPLRSEASKNPKNEQSSTAYKNADLNSDGVVDNKDLDLMQKKINK